MLKYLLITLALLCGCGYGQRSIDKTLASLNKGSVPYIHVRELAGQTQAVLLDTRSPEEYGVSHLQGAIWTGYDAFDIQRVREKVTDTNTEIVVYCSIGVRSEDIGEKLQQAGYRNVRNLYGGIFKWKSEGQPVYDPQGQPTEKVHAYSKFWGRFLTNAEKVYNP